MRLISKLTMLALAGVLVATILAGPAQSQETDTYVSGEVVETDPSVLVVDPADPGDPAVLGAQQERGDDPALPVTGGDVTTLVALALMAIAGGTVAVMVARSRHSAPAENLTV